MFYFLLANDVYFYILINMFIFTFLMFQRPHCKQICRKVTIFFSNMQEKNLFFCIFKHYNPSQSKHYQTTPKT